MAYRTGVLRLKDVHQAINHYLAVLLNPKQAADIEVGQLHIHSHSSWMSRLRRSVRLLRKSCLTDPGALLGTTAGSFGAGLQFLYKAMNQWMSVSIG